MGELRITVSDRIVVVLLGLFVFALLFNVMYSFQRDLNGFFAIPMWIIFIMICLVAKPMRDQKLIAYVGLLVLGIALEYYRFTHGPTKEFDPFKFVFLVVGLYSMVLWYFMALLFARLDVLHAEYQTIAAEVKGLGEESVRVAKAVEKAASAPDASQTVEYLGPAANYGLYRKAFGDLAAVRMLKDLPGYLARVLKDGFGIDRGIVVELPQDKPAVVREAWGEALPKSAGAISQLKFPQSLVAMVTEKMGAVLHGEIEQEGPHTPDLALMSEANTDPYAIFPIITHPAVADGAEVITHLVVALGPSNKTPSAAAEWAESMDGVSSAVPKPKVELRVLPVQTVLDVLGQFVSRLKAR